jgi:hypothetical protein
MQSLHDDERYTLVGLVPLHPTFAAFPPSTMLGNPKNYLEAGDGSNLALCPQCQIAVIELNQHHVQNSL